MYFIGAVVAAVCASLFFAASAVLELRSTHEVPTRGVFAPRLLLDLARRPLWLLSIVATLAGLALQVTALHFGPLALVQPILVCDLIFAVLMTAALRHAAPDRILFAGVVCAAAGVAVFLAVAEPTGGNESVSLPAVIPLAAALAAVLAGCLVWAKRGTRNTRPLALALACGICYGVTAFLLKLVTFSLGEGFSEPLTQWPLYAVAVVGPVGFLLNQEAFQAGTLISPVLAVITTVDPLVSIGIAVLWLDEEFANSPADIAIEVTALAVMTAGIIMLAHRAPVVASQRAAAEAQAATASREAV